MKAKDLKPYNVYEVMNKKSHKTHHILIQSLNADNIEVRFFYNNSVFHHDTEVFDSHYEILKNLTEESNPAVSERENVIYHAPKVLLDGDFVADGEVLKHLLEHFFYHIRTYKIFEFGDAYDTRDAFCDSFPNPSEIKTVHQVIDKFLSYDYLDTAINIKKHRDKAKNEPEAEAENITVLDVLNKNTNIAETENEPEAEVEKPQETKPEMSEYMRKHQELMTAFFAKPEGKIFFSEPARIIYRR